MYVRGMIKSPSVPSIPFMLYTNGALSYNEGAEARYQIQLATGQTLITYLYPQDMKPEMVPYPTSVKEIAEGFWDQKDNLINKLMYSLLSDPPGERGSDEYEKWVDDMAKLEPEGRMRKVQEWNEDNWQTIHAIHSIFPMKYTQPIVSNTSSPLKKLTVELNPMMPEIPDKYIVMWEDKNRFKIGFEKTWMAYALSSLQRYITQVIEPHLMRQYPGVEAIGSGTLEVQGPRSGDHSYRVQKDHGYPTSHIDFGGYKAEFYLMSETHSTAEERRQAAITHVLAYQLIRTVPIVGLTVGDYCALATTVLWMFKGLGTSIPLDKFFDTSSIQEQVLKFIGMNEYAAEKFMFQSQESWEEWFYLCMLIGLYIARGYNALATPFQIIKSKTTLAYVHDLFKDFTKPSFVASGLAGTATPYFLQNTNDYKNSRKLIPFPMIIRTSGDANTWKVPFQRTNISMKSVDIHLKEVEGTPFNVTKMEEWLVFHAHNDTRIVTYMDQVDRILTVIEIPIWERSSAETVTEQDRWFIWLMDLMSLGPTTLSNQYRLGPGLGLFDTDPLEAYFTTYWNFGLIKTPEQSVNIAEGKQTVILPGQPVNTKLEGQPDPVATTITPPAPPLEAPTGVQTAQGVKQSENTNTSGTGS